MKTVAARPKIALLGEKYDANFYAGQIAGSLQAARVILGLLFGCFRPISVLDVGCGQGAWLAAAEELGCTRLTGVDGPWVDPHSFLSSNIAFATVDLEQAIEIPERFDLCICVEVAEHLSAGRASGFVEFLSGTSDVVLFSAAVRLQGGINHINEQWQSYWGGLFAAVGYECYDLIRPRIWENKTIESWYRQNVLLYVRSGHPLAEIARTESFLRGPVDIVHPEVYEGNLGGLQRAVDEPTLRFCVQSFGKWGRRQFRKVFDRGK